MAQMHTLVLNGQSYTVTDPTAARIDDTQTGEGAWSAQRIVQEIGSRERSVIDRLCPNFSAKGGEVTCQPVEGSALQVVSYMEPVHTGSGTPSPDNVRPITGYDSITLNHNDSCFTAQLGQTVYGGAFNWSTGELTVTYTAIVFDGVTYDRRMTATDEGATTYAYIVPSIPPKLGGKLYGDRASCSTPNGAAIVVFISKEHTGVADGDDRAVVNGKFNAVLKSWYDAGTPLTCVYEMKNPVAVQLTPRELLALSGENVLSGDTGETEVSGKADPMSVLQDIFSRLDALEQKEE